MGGSPAISERAVVSDPASQDLAQAMQAFNEVVVRLHETHDTLRAEVSRLKGELQEANRRLRRSQELAALGEMAAGIAHEVRNPLGSIRLYASMLEGDLGDRPEQKEVAAKIGRAVIGLDRIVGDVLDFSRSLQVTVEPMEADALLQRAVDACRAMLGSGDGAVEIRHEASDAMVWCDASMLHRALVNILRNGVEAALEGSKPRWVRISAARTNLRAANGVLRPATALRVEDSGDGLPDEVVGRMFNPFFTTRAAGTGLGLAIVHRIVDAHEGSVLVRNGAHGAIIELVIPEPLQGPERDALVRGGESQFASKGLDAAMQGSSS